jgi:prephenate dehydrogenase
VPDRLRCDDLAALVAGADAVVLATPVHAFRAGLEGLRPHLTPAQVVIDVGSVKTAPEANLREVLGGDVPWVATHPLFGPASLARGERPLRVVLCPNPLHPHAVGRVRGLYEHIGCEVVEQDAASHDEAMAQTHALVFFLAKALLDIGVERVPFVPPSFQAISSAVEAVRADAGHLFLTIQRDNPYSASARRRLIEALQSIHEHLGTLDRHEEATGGSEAGAVAARAAAMNIPDLGAASPDLLEIRELIDELDGELMALLARRVELSRRAGRNKARRGEAVRDPAREKQLLDERAGDAQRRGLDPDGVRDVFEAIMRHSRTVQREEP